MAWQDDLDIHLLGAGGGGVEVVYFEPEKHAISIRLEIGVADAAVMVLDLPLVQLQYETAV
ncbi:MAG: hypothetical protein JWP03_639 [Phycisphaerales bacterium]|nr:hypothetical protein [Phycisphaerales bacterium]